MQPIKSAEPMYGKKPAERALLYYLQLRSQEKRGGATQAEMAEETGMCDRSIGSAVRALAKGGEIN